MKKAYDLVRDNGSLILDQIVKARLNDAQNIIKGCILEQLAAFDQTELKQAIEITTESSKKNSNFNLVKTVFDTCIELLFKDETASD